MLGNFMYCNPTKLYFGEDCVWRRIDQKEWYL